MKRLLLILFSVTLLPFTPQEARGCSCIEYDVPVCAAYWRADAVFVGQVLDITVVEERAANQLPQSTLHFIVEQPFRGITGNRVDVQTLHGTEMAYRDDKLPKITTTDALTTFEYKVQVAKNQCHYAQIDTFKIDLHATAEISGKVLTASGRPVSPGYVYLVHAEDPDNRGFMKVEDDGTFKFQDVAVGEYYLVLNPDNKAPDEDDAPYPRTYYPNATEASAATKIVVTEGAQLENLMLRVGPRWKERVVTGRVVWQDGRSPQNAHISLYDGDRYIRMIAVDEKGRFNFKVYGDFKYAINAEVWGDDRGKSARVLIPKAKSTGLKLILKRVD